MMKLKPYPEYRDSNVEWLGEVPEHWPLERAKWLFSKMQRPVRPQDGVVTCFRDGIVTLRKNRRTAGFTESIKEIGYQGVREGDLVIHGMDGFAGAIGVSDSDGKCTPVYSICQPKGNMCVKYYAFIAREMARTQWILALARGIRERSTDFRFGTFAGQFVPVPPRNEQDLIVGFLSAQLRLIDRFIRNKGRLIKLLQEQKQAVINDCVTGKMEVRRIVDENGNSSFRLQPSSCKMRDSGIDWLGKIPEHWEVRRFKNVCRLQRGHDLSNDRFVEGEYPVYGSNGVIGHHNSFTTKAPCITVGRSGSVGKVNYVERDFWAHNTTLYAIDNCNNDWRFLFYVLKNTDLKMVSGGSAVPTLNRNYIHELHVAIPSLEDQYQIASSLDETIIRIEHSISNIERQIDLIQEYRTRLIADVVTGKVDVRGIPVEDVAED